MRAVEKRPIFDNDNDCSRFIYQMYAGNLGRSAFNVYRKNLIYIADNLLRGEELPWKMVNDRREVPIADVLSFALVNDHAHFILSPNTEDGISKYIHKLKVSFSKYYNSAHDREGILFNRSFKRIPLETTSEIEAAIRYVNVKCPLDVYNSEWKNGVENWQEAFDFVSKYKYSSYSDLFDKRNSKLLAPRAILEKYIGGELNKNSVENIDFIENYLGNKLDHYYPVFLEKNVKTL